MIRNPELHKVYYFISWSNKIERCMLKDYYPEEKHNEEHWKGKCLDSTGNRSFLRVHLFETEKEVKLIKELAEDAEKMALEKQLETPKKTIELMAKQFYNNLDYQYHLKPVIKKKIKEHFEIEISS